MVQQAGLRIESIWELLPPAPLPPMKLLFMEMGVRYNQHGCEFATTWACQDAAAITSNSFPAFRIGVLNFNSTSATHVYINPDDDYVTSLVERFATTCPRLILAPHSSIPEKTFEEQVFENRMTIGELMRGEWIKESKGFKITIVGVIKSVDQTRGWFYFGCKSCQRKVEICDGGYTCFPCNLESSESLALYRIHLNVVDDTSGASCVLMQRAAEHLLDTSAMKLFNKGDPSSPVFPKEVLDLEGRRFIFKLSLTDYNLKGGAVFTIFQVFTPDEKLEAAFKETHNAKVLPTAVKLFVSNDQSI